MDALALIIVSLVSMGGGVGLAMWLRGNKKSKDVTRVESTVLLERIEKVFKVVLAEGHFSEIHEHFDEKEVFFGLSTETKKALIVTKARVLVGYDFAKVKIDWQEGTSRMVVKELPPAEILSIDSDYSIYDINQGLLNRFQKDEYTKLLADAKQVIFNKAVASELPLVAERQVRALLTQLADTAGWRIDFALPAPPPPPIALPEGPGKA